MRSGLYYVLDYSHSRLIGPLAELEVCVTLRVLETIEKEIQFDILERSLPTAREIVTCEFLKSEDDGHWYRGPVPPAARAAMGG